MVEKWLSIHAIVSVVALLVAEGPKTKAVAGSKQVLFTGEPANEPFLIAR